MPLVLLAAVPAAAAPLAAPCAAGQGYDPACDVDHDGDIDVLDIQLTAGRWGASGTFVDDSWSLTGNAGTTPGTNFLGTSDNLPLEIRVNGQRALRIAPAGSGGTATPNIVGGGLFNSVTPGVVGATIAGGGRGGPDANLVTDDFGTIGGGLANQAGDNSGGTTVATNATVGGGSGNAAAAGNFSFAAGRRAKTNAHGAFVWADSLDFDFAPGANNAFTARTTGGARFILGVDGTGAWTW